VVGWCEVASASQLIKFLYTGEIEDAMLDEYI
jgi:hypothetical protein